MSVRTFRNLESGRTAPRLTTVELIIDGLDLDDDRAERLREAARPAPPGHALPASPSAPTPRQLPADTRHFSGREAQLRWLDDATGATGGAAPPLVLVCGAAGVGKTALAVRWARRGGRTYADGELHVDLRGYGPDRAADPAEVLARLLATLGVDATGTTLEDLTVAWRSTLAGREVLLLLDNAATAEQVRPLLPATAGCCVLVTSRDTLPGLVARDGAARLDLDVLTTAESAGLLMELIGDAARGNPAEVRRLADLCAHLPLALRIAGELATAQPHTRLADLVDRLARDPLNALDSSGDPHTALRTVLMSSYRALPAHAARALRLLGVNPTATVDLAGAARLVGVPTEVAGANLDVLVRAHMISRVDDGHYAMHDLLHAFTRELADADPVASAAAFSRLADHLLAATRAAVAGPEDEARRWLAERRRLLVATAVAANRYGRSAATVEFAELLGEHLDAAAAYDDVLALFTCAAAAADHLGRVADAAEAWRRIGVAHYRLGQPDPATAAARRALEAYRACGDRRGEARCLMNIGSVRWRSGFGDEALAWYRGAHETYHAAGDVVGEADVLCNMGNVFKEHGRNDLAIRHYRDAATIYRRVGDHRRQAIAAANLGTVYLKLGRLDEAREAQVLSLALAREMGERTAEGIALGNLGEVELQAGNDRDARRHFLASLLIAREIGDRIGEGLALDHLGVIHRRRGGLDRAGRLHRQGLEIAGQTGHRDGECGALVHLAEVAVACDRPDEARRLCAEAVALAAEINSPSRLAQGLTVLATAYEADGESRAALTSHRRALACARLAGDAVEQAAALIGLARHHDRHGHRRVADRHRRTATAAVVGGPLPALRARALT